MKQSSPISISSFLFVVFSSVVVDVNSFSVVCQTPTSSSRFSTATTSTQLRSSSPSGGDDQEEENKPQGLVLDGLDDQLQKMKGQFQSYELDYLAAAKKRAEQKVASVEGGARDDDWKSLADEKKDLYGEIDDWENSKKEAGNVDSQILMFTEPSKGDGEDGEGGEDEPKLLLF